MTGKRRPRVIGTTVIVVSLFSGISLAVLACSQIATHAMEHSLQEAERGSHASGGGTRRARATLDKELIAQFKRDFLAADETRPVFDKYLGVLGATAILSVLEAMYPALYRQIQDGVISYIAETGITDVPYAKRLQLGILFNMPTDPSLMPEQMVAYYEASLVLEEQEQQQAQQQQPQQRAPKPMSAGARKMMKQEMSAMDQVAANRS